MNKYLQTRNLCGGVVIYLQHSFNAVYLDPNWIKGIDVYLYIT